MKVVQHFFNEAEKLKHWNAEKKIYFELALSAHEKATQLTTTD